MEGSKQYFACKRCVYDYPEIPDLVLNEEGICNYCLEWQKREEERQVEATNLPWRLDAIRRDGKGKKYDVIFGLSGGVDSSYALHIALQHGLRPLCFGYDDGFNDPRADENTMKMVEKLKVP